MKSILRLTALDVGNQQQQQQEENVSARVTDHRNTIIPRCSQDTPRWLPGVNRHHLRGYPRTRKYKTNGVTRRGAIASNRIDEGERREDARYKSLALFSLYTCFSPCLPTLHTPPRTMSRSHDGRDDDDEERELLRASRSARSRATTMCNRRGQRRTRTIGCCARHDGRHG